MIDFAPELTIEDLDGQTLVILTSGSLISSEFGSVTDNFNAGNGTFSYDVLFQGNQVLLSNFELSIPEPSSGLLALGMLGLFLRKRRNQRGTAPADV